MLFFPGLSSDLAWVAAWVFVFGLLVSSRYLPLRCAAPVSLIKVAIPFLYFAHNPSGSLHLLDDIQYFQSGVSLLRMGFDPFSVFTDTRAFAALATVAGTNWHVAYPWLNLVAVDFLGAHYYAPVFLNIGATFVSGFFLVRILARSGFSRLYCRGVAGFFLLHWDVIAWSSFLNLKDTLVVTLVLALLQQCVELFDRPRLWRVIPVLLIVTGLFFLRFYAPLFVAAAAGAYWILRKKGGWRIAGVVAWIAAAAFFYRLVPGTAGHIHLAEFFRGLPQFLLTPLPWKLSPGYEFLFLPAALHLILLAPALLAIPSLWKRAGHARLLIVYLIVVLVVFAVLPENRGIRQRQMAGFVFVWLQFHALAAFARYVLARDDGRTPRN